MATTTGLRHDDPPQGSDPPDGSGASAENVEVGLLRGADSDLIVAPRVRRFYVFGAQSPDTGYEPWVSDGTPEGTRLVLDILPGGLRFPLSSGPRGFAEIGNGRAVFAAEDDTRGVEPWVTDGTPEGTRFLSDILPGRFSGLAQFFGTSTVFTVTDTGRALFPANNGTTGDEPWVTDGTPDGTRLLRDINPGRGSNPDFSPGGTHIGGGRALFSADDGVHGVEPWVTDGTPQGTRLLLDIRTGDAGSPSFGTFAFADLGGGRVLFRANDGTQGQEAWVTDGTPEGTRLLRDINPGPDDSTPVVSPYLPSDALAGGQVVFSVTDGTNGREPWVTDGTPEGTRMVRDINPGPDDSGPSFAFPTGAVPLDGGRIVFTANDGAHGIEPWVTDGTPESTRLLSDVKPGLESSTFFGNPDVYSIDGKLAFFAVDDGVHGEEPWVTDGTPEGTQLLLDINPGAADSSGFFGSNFHDVGNGLALFSAFDPEHGIELWVTDGRTEGTRLIDINPGPESSNPALSFLLDAGNLGGGRVLFVAEDETHGREPWVTDGTPEGTRPVEDIFPGLGSSSPDGFTEVIPFAELLRRILEGVEIPSVDPFG
jgi:ELWxxDGT repeat protein